MLSRFFALSFILRVIKVDDTDTYDRFIEK